MKINRVLNLARLRQKDVQLTAIRTAACSSQTSSVFDMVCFDFLRSVFARCWRRSKSFKFPTNADVHACILSSAYMLGLLFPCVQFCGIGLRTNFESIVGRLLHNCKYVQTNIQLITWQLSLASTELNRNDWRSAQSSGSGRSNTDSCPRYIRCFFDTVVRSNLPSLLRGSFDVGGNALSSWISSYQSGRSQTVLVGSASSIPSSCGCEVPQASVLGPIIFTGYTINISNCGSRRRKPCA